VEALNAIQETAPVQLPARGPAREALTRFSYVQAIAWIGACLAEALQYAHERGLVHLDIKPSNVLLAVDGQPMLLDFHLAQKPIRPGEPPPEHLGGSLPYMAKEQKAAVKAVHQKLPIPAAVDERADVYSLGALLYEAMGGQLPYRRDASAPLNDCNSLVSVGLSDIIRKCLAPEPAGRYATAGALAVDLRRHLNHQSLVGVRNRNLGERWRKWRRRRPYDLPVAGLLAAVLIASGAVLSVRQDNLEHQRRQVQVVMATGRDQLQLKHWDDALSTLRHGLLLVEGLPQESELRAEVTTLLDRAEQGQTARDLARLTNRLRFLYGADTLPPAELRALEVRCRPFWEVRRRIMARLGSEERSETTTDAVRTDLLDLAILWTDLCVQVADKNLVAAARREALAVLGQAEDLFGPSAVVSHVRQAHADALGKSSAELPAPPPPRTAWEHYALGRSFLQASRLDRASAELQEALVLEPQGFWPNFYQGTCAYRLEQYQEALTAFSVCIGAEPENAICFYNRALAYTGLQCPKRALKDYDHALRLDATLAPAALNRGLLHYDNGRWSEAAADFQHALEHGADPATIHYNLALVHRAQGNRTSALESARRALEYDPAHRPARQLQESLQRGSE
jgi:tetratricopeptide (TPR) repeat protein